MGMFEDFLSEKEIKEKLSELKEIDEDMYLYLINEKIKFNKVKVLKKIVGQTIKRYLVKIIGYQKATIKEYFLRFIEEYQKRISVKKLVDIINRPTDKKKILYLTCSPTLNLMRESIYLRKAGYETILLMESVSLIKFAERCFDVVYTFDSIYTLFYILKKANPYLIHVQGTTRRANHFAILAKLLSKSKIVFNFYDIPSTAGTKEDLVFVGEKKDVELDFFSERFACERCDGIIFGYSAEVGEILKSRYHISSPMLEFNSYACDEFIQNNTSKYSREDGKIHIVYGGNGGNVVPSSLSKGPFREAKFPRLIEKITRQGVYFDIYVNLNMVPWRIKREFGDYMLMSKKNIFFNFKKGLLPDEATKEFSKYDFGAMIYLFNKANKGICMKEHNRMRLPDKFFTYLEAGLPILISEEHQYVARLVKEYEIGIVVNQKDLDNLTEIINSYDREQLKANVKRAREELSMKRHIVRLINFYEQITENNG